MLDMIPYDKKLHLLAGFAVGIFPAIFLPMAGTVTAAFAGLYKEYDDGHGDTRGTVDKNDWTATVLGGLAADAVAFGATLLVAALFLL
jgi:hypothetical protein